MQQLNKTNLINLTTEQAFKVIKMLDVKRAKDYNDYITIMMCLKCENNNDMFDVFNEFYKLNADYNYGEAKQMWDEYEVEENIYNYGLLLLNCKKDNEQAYNFFVNNNNIFKECDKLESAMVNVDVPYLLMDRKIKNCEVSKTLVKFINNKIRHLCIKSAYDTGKTTLLKEICNNYKRILFISYRITLSQDLMGNFKSSGFNLYTDKITSPKIICQIDSLYKLPSNNFDLIIIDEIESVLNHLNASTLQFKESVFNSIYNMCDKSKVIALDGDIGDRSKLFLGSLTDDYTLINNINQKNSKHFVFHSNELNFDKEMDKKLITDKNICIVSMTEKMSKFYYNKYKDTHKTILYTSTCDDKQKRMLCDVKSIWSQYQIVIYTPCVESGVNYDISHFDSIFCVMSCGSTSQRGLFQMLNRVRKIEDNNINVFLNNIPANTECFDYKINEIETYYNNIDDSDNNVTKTFKKITHHNQLEELNKSPSCFLPIFINMLIEKGNTHEFKNDKMKKVNKTNFNLEQVLASDNITIDDLEELKLKQQLGNATEVEKYKLLKYYYQKTFKIEFSPENKDAVAKFFNNMDMVANCKKLCGIYEGDVQSEKIKEIVKIVFDTDVNEGDKTISKEIMDEKVILMNKYFNEHRIFFLLDKNFVVETPKQLLGKLKSLFIKYGLTIIRNRKSQYTFSVIEEVKPLLKVKTRVVNQFIDYELDDYFKE